MSRAAVNPIVLSTPSPQGLSLRKMLATDTRTWKAGELCYLTSGTVSPLSSATGGTAVYGIFAETQSTTTSSTSCWVRVLEEGTMLLAYLIDNGSAEDTAGVTIGQKYAAYATSNVCYVDKNVTSSGQFRIVKKIDNSDTTDPMPERASYDGQTTTATPGMVIVEFYEPAGIS